MADDTFYGYEPVTNLTLSIPSALEMADTTNTTSLLYEMYTNNFSAARPPAFDNLSQTFVPMNTSDIVVWREQRHILLQRIFYGIAFALISFACTIGNCTVIWIVLSHRKMRTVTNFAIAHLALADLMLGSWNPVLVCQFLVTQHWQYGSALCVASNFVAHHSIALSVFTLISISIDRYMAIMRPLNSLPRSSKRLLTTLLIIWAAAFVLSLPPLIFSKVVFINGREVCVISFPDGIYQSWDLLFNSIFMLVTYVVPMIALGITYTRIGLHLWNQQIIGNLSEAQLCQIQQKRRLVRVLICVLVSFLVCWFPYQLYFVVSNIWVSMIEVPGIQHVYICFYWLAMSSSVYNPIIYVILNKKYRKGFISAWSWLPCIRSSKHARQHPFLGDDASAPSMLSSHFHNNNSGSTSGVHSAVTRQSSHEMTNLSATSTISSINNAAASSSVSTSNHRNSPRLSLHNDIVHNVATDAGLLYKIMHKASPSKNKRNGSVASDNHELATLDDARASNDNDHPSPHPTASALLIPPLAGRGLVNDGDLHGWSARSSRQPSVIQEEELEAMNADEEDDDDEDCFND